MTRALLVVACVAGGCKKPVDDASGRCADAAQNAVDGMVARARQRIEASQLPEDVRARTEARATQLEQLAPRLRAVLANRCIDDKWPGDVVACYAQSAGIDEMRACRVKLPAEQQAKLQREELDLLAGTIGPPGFGAPARPTSPEIEKLEAELRELNERLQVAVTKVSDATTPAERDAAQGELRELQTKMQDVNQRLDAARARAAAPPTP